MDVAADRRPALFVLETVYQGKTHVVADGVAFHPPCEQVVINWRSTASTELLDSVEQLYAKYGAEPRVMWWHSEDVLTEVEPADVVSGR